MCRTTRPRFTWPALRWEAVRGDDEACRLCAQVVMAQEATSEVHAYPVGDRVPWQPQPGGLFEPVEPSQR